MAVRSSRITSPENGTCWLYTSELAVTAAHVTGASDTVATAAWGPATVVWRDHDLDLAVLRLVKPADGRHQQPRIGGHADAGAEWSAHAFPDANPEGHVLKGVVTHPSGATYEGITGLLQLFNPSGGADDVGGASGAAIVVGGRVVGIVRAGTSGGHDIYASHADWLNRYCPQFFAPPSKHRRMGLVFLGEPNLEIHAQIASAAASAGCSVSLHTTTKLSELLQSLSSLATDPFIIVGSSRDVASVGSAAVTTKLWADVTFVIVDDDTQRTYPTRCPNMVAYPTAANGIALETFRARISRRLIDVATDPSVASRMRNALSAISSTCTELLEQHGAESVFLQFFAGWLQQIPTELPEPGARTFHTSTRYYRGCLRSLHDWHSTANAVAVADLSDEIEQWWLLSNELAVETTIRERIFLLDPIHVISRDDDNWWEQTLATLRRESQRSEAYKVYIARLPDPDTDHPLCAPRRDADAAGDGFAAWDIIVFPGGAPGTHATVGGYVSVEGDGTYIRHVLKVSQDPEVVQKATIYYNTLRERAIEFDARWSKADLRKAWVEKYKVGVWQSHWHDKIQKRDDAYFVHYDEHIRCWVPHYDHLVQLCAQRVQHEVLRQSQRPTGNLSLLEIGYGTGTLTSQMCTWLARYEAISSGYHGTEYRGVDCAERMQSRATRIAPDAQLLLGEFPSAMGSITQGAHLMFGSLVMHDIWGDDWTKGLAKMFTYARKHLFEGGALIFADVFLSESHDDRQYQEAFWRDWIRRIGIRDEHAEFFFSKNSEMLAKAPNVAELRRVADENGFDVDDVDYAVTSQNPFGVMRLQPRRGA